MIVESRSRGLSSRGYANNSLTAHLTRSGVLPNCSRTSWQWSHQLSYQHFIHQDRPIKCIRVVSLGKLDSTSFAK